MFCVYSLGFQGEIPQLQKKKSSVSNSLFHMGNNLVRLGDGNYCMHPAGFTISFWILLGLLHHEMSVERGRKGCSVNGGAVKVPFKRQTHHFHEKAISKGGIRKVFMNLRVLLIYFKS